MRVTVVMNMRYDAAKEQSEVMVRLRSRVKCLNNPHIERSTNIIERITHIIDHSLKS